MTLLMIVVYDLVHQHFNFQVSHARLNLNIKSAVNENLSVSAILN